MSKNILRASVIAIVVMWLIWPLILPLLANVMPANKDLGPYGDMFGAINALFTALAFAALIWTALLQREELSLQRRELHETRVVMRDQASTIHQQAFESTFFQLLRFHIELRSQVQYSWTEEFQDDDGVDQTVLSESGTEAFRGMSRRLSKQIVFNRHRKEKDRHPDELKFALSEHENDYKIAGTWLGPYFRNLYHLIRLVDESDTLPSQKDFYMSLVRAQLSEYELEVLFFNCLSPRGVTKFKPLLERHAILKHLGRNVWDSLRKSYLAEAFGKTAEPRGPTTPSPDS